MKRLRDLGRNVRSGLGLGLRRGIGTTVLLSTAILVGCSGNGSDDDLGPAELQEINVEIALKKRWAVKVGDGQGGVYNRLVPMLVNDVVVAAAANGEVSVFDVDSGDRRWRVRTREDIGGGAFANDQQVVVGTLRGELISLAMTDGTEQWRSQLSSEIVGAAVEHRGLLVARTVDGRVHGLDAVDGSVKWSFSSTLPVLTLRGYSKPVFFEDLVIVGLANGKLAALDRETGIVRWENRIAIGQGRSEIERIVDIDASPVLAGRLIIAASYQGRVLAFDAANGKPVWQATAATFNDLGEGFGNVYVVNKDSDVVALSRRDGSFRWEQLDLSRRRLTAPVAAGSYLFLGDYDGYLHAISQVDGRIAGRKRVDRHGMRAPVVVDGELLLAYGNSGRLVAYDITDKFKRYRNTGGIPARGEVMRKRGLHAEWEN